MTAIRPSELFPEFAQVPGLDNVHERRYPYEGVALAVARLRGSLGLTQTEFGRQIGTTQSVIARLESGRHGIQVSLLNRIAAAFGGTWFPVFAGLAGESEAEPELAVVETSGDDLLDAFNQANTAGDFAAARIHAKRIARAPNTPRRQVALALDAFNRGKLPRALEWATKALATNPPERSRQVAALVAGRSLLGMGRAQEALESLAGAGEAWLAEAARAEATMEAGRPEDAVVLAERLLAEADDETRAPAAYLAARTYWHANRPFDALAHIGAFRSLEPSDRSGRLLNGAILGYIGDTYDDHSAYASAMTIFEEENRDDDPECLRLFAMTAARVGDWHRAMRSARQVLDLAGPRDTKTRDVVWSIAGECFDRIDDPDDLQGAADLAADLGLVEDKIVRSQRALAQAIRGDFEGAVAALGLEPERLHEADPKDQVRCAVAFISGSRFAEAYPILRRCETELSNPDGQLFLAQSALAAMDTTTAREALRRMTGGDGAAADTARVAIELVQSIESSGKAQILSHMRMFTDEHTTRLLPIAEGRPAPRSPWEGPASRDGEPVHDPVSPVLDRFTRIGLAIWALPDSIAN
jgi:tetratricopeptide (TPR) repeat protein